MHADYTYPCTPKLPPHLAQSFTNIYLVLNPPTIFTLHVITQPFYANLYMLCVHWWSTFRLCWFLVSSCMKTLNIFKMPPCIHQCTLPFKRRVWWQPIAQTTPPMILLVIASARKCSLCWSKCWSAHTQLHALKTLVGAIYKWVGSNWGNQGISMSQLPPWCQGSSPHSSWQLLPRRVILGIAEAWLWIPEQISGWGVNLVLVNTSVPKLATWCQLCGRGQCVHFGRTCVYWRWWH